MEAQDIPDKSASTGTISGSFGLPSTPVLSIRKARKADEKIRADNIARSKATMVRQAIKASATATRIPDETPNALQNASESKMPKQHETQRLKKTQQ